MEPFEAFPSSMVNAVKMGGPGLHRGGKTIIHPHMGNDGTLWSVRDDNRRVDHRRRLQNHVCKVPK